MFVLLKKKFQGQEPGAKIDVSDHDAKSLCEAGIAEEVKGDPLADLAEKALEEKKRGHTPISYLQIG